MFNRGSSFLIHFPLCTVLGRVFQQMQANPRNKCFCVSAKPQLHLDSTISSSCCNFSFVMVVFSLSSQCCDYGLVRVKRKTIWRGVRKKKIIVWLKLHVLITTIMHGNDQTSLEKYPGIYVVTKLSVFFKGYLGIFPAVNLKIYVWVSSKVSRDVTWTAISHLATLLDCNNINIKF